MFAYAKEGTANETICSMYAVSVSGRMYGGPESSHTDLVA